MAGGQTPWAGELPPGTNPFNEAGATGAPTMPPPPPSFAPGEEPEAEAGGGRQLPVSKPVIYALAAIVVLGGGYGST